MEQTVTLSSREAALEAVPDGPVVWDQAAMMERLGDDAELMVEIVDLLLEDIPLRLAELRAATTPDAVRRAAHAIKGAVANVGGDAAAAAMLAVEHAAAQGRMEDLLGLRAHAETAWQTLQTTLTAWRTPP